MDWKMMMYSDRFPRSNNYDPEFVAENQMGPSSLWLTEWLCEKIEIDENTRILDLGCGRAMSSIFLAREYGALVFATDLWIDPSENLKRIKEFGLENKVFPIKAEAHSLPFAKNSFDVIIAVDSYGYFGTDELYLSYITSFLKPGGIIATALPGLTKEFDNFKVPDHLLQPQENGNVFWEPDCFTFHSKEWWYNHWNKTCIVDFEVADNLEDGYKYWATQEKALDEAGFNLFPSDEETLLRDKGEYISFVRLVAKKKMNEEQAMPHAWQPEFSSLCEQIFTARDKNKK